MVRLIFFIIAAAVLAWGVVWLSDNPGQVSLNWGGWQIDTSAGVLVAGVVLLITGVALGYRFWTFIRGAPKQIASTRRARRSRQGYRALTQGMVAVAAGDAEESRRQVAKADGLLGEPPLTLLLKAQSAQLNGDELAAERFFTAMLSDPEMEFLGLRGLLNQAIKRGDEVVALDLARRAQALKPKSEWLAQALFDLEARAGTWAAAGEALSHVIKLTAPGKGESRHRQAVVALGQSLEAEASGDPVKALKYSEKAVSLDTGLTAAAVHLAYGYVGRGYTRKAQNVIEKAWTVRPHPDLVDWYLKARKVSDPLGKVSALEKLLACHPGSVEGHIAMAQAALQAQLWGQARTHLGAARQAGCETRTVFTLMATLEEQEHGDGDQARAWLTRAASASADPAWVCGDCGHVQTQWSAHCPKCKTFDRMTWTTPPGVAMSAAGDQTVALLSHAGQAPVGLLGAETR